MIYTNEFVLHAWDLAKATGQSPEWDPEMLAAPLAHMHRAVPAEPRGGQVPFGPVVEVHEDVHIDKRRAGTDVVPDGATRQTIERAGRRRSIRRPSPRPGS